MPGLGECEAAPDERNESPGESVVGHSRLGGLGSGQWAAECRREQRRRHWDARRIHRRASLLLQANCAASKTASTPDEAGGTRERRLVSTCS